MACGEHGNNQNCKAKDMRRDTKINNIGEKVIKVSTLPSGRARGLQENKYWPMGEKIGHRENSILWG